MLINERASTGLKYVNDSKALFEYPNNMDNIYQNIGKCNKQKKIFTLFYDMSADMASNKGIYPIYTEVFLEEEN